MPWMPPSTPKLLLLPRQQQTQIRQSRFPNSLLLLFIKRIRNHFPLPLLNLYHPTPSTSTPEGEYLSSTESFMTRRNTVTRLGCPRRCTRSTAWSSMDGAHQLSPRITCDAATRFKPTEHTLRDASMMVWLGDEENVSNAPSRCRIFIFPSNRTYFQPFFSKWHWITSRNAVNCENTIVLTPGSLFRVATIRYGIREVRTFKDV